LVRSWVGNCLLKHVTEVRIGGGGGGFKGGGEGGKEVKNYWEALGKRGGGENKKRKH